MNQLETIKKTSDFVQVYQQGRSYGNRLLVLYVRNIEPGQAGRIGISVSKKVGNSVIRHRIRRLIKESFRLHLSEWPDKEYVVVAKREAKGKDYFEIEKALLHLGRKTEVLKQGEKP